MPKTEQKLKKTSFARLSDGTIQITLVIPKKEVDNYKEQALRDLAQSLSVPGFRKGKAPQKIAEQHIKQEDLYNHILEHLLPEKYKKAIEENKIKPVITPKFELISLGNDSDWQIRAVTAELPSVELPDYKKLILTQAFGKTRIWTPGKSQTTNGKKEEMPREEKEQKIIETIIKNTKAIISQVIIDNEVTERLSRLLDQTQKLGLTIEQYFASTGKDIKKVREDFGNQAREAITLELALNQIAEKEEITTDETEVDQAVKAVADTSQEKQPVSESQKRMIKAILMRRKALDRLIALI